MTTGMNSFAVQVLTGRWFTVLASLLIMSTTGATYMFPLYSSDIKSSLGYDQTTLNLMSFFKDLGANVGILSGLINEVTPAWIVLLIGALLNLIGYTMIWVEVTKKMKRPGLWQMCLYLCIGANSQNFAKTGVLVTCVENFPESRGVVMGLLKGYAGLSGAIMTQLYHAFYEDDSTSLILFIAWLPAAVSMVFLSTVRIIKVVHQPNEVKTFYDFLYISHALAFFLMMIIIVEKRLTFTQTEYDGSAAIVIFMLFLPLIVVLFEENKLRILKNLAANDQSPIKVKTETIEHTTNKEEEEKESKNDYEVEKAASCRRTIFSPPERGNVFTILQALFSIDMFILLLASFCGIGGILTAIDSLGQIGTSLGYSKRSISTFLSLVSICNYLGHVLAGVVSDIFLVKYKLPRPLMLTIVMLISCIGHLLIAFDVPKELYSASVIIGLCFGAQRLLLFTIISELFGLKHSSTLYNFGSVASTIGSYLLNVRVAGSLYDKEASKQLTALGIKRQAGDHLDCTGVDCFQLSFIIIAATTLLGTLVSCILVSRTMKFYESDIYKKSRQEVDAAEREMSMVGMATGLMPEKGK